MRRKRKKRPANPLTKTAIAKKCRMTRKKCVLMAKTIIRNQEDHKCERCGKGEPENQTQGSHIFPEKRYRMMSADVDNILCLCASCHKFSASSWHESPLEAAEWFFKTFPGRYEQLKKRSRRKIDDCLDFWQDKLQQLTELARENNAKLTKQSK